MKNSKILVLNAGIVPKLRLGTKTDKGVKSNGSHIVKILEDKIVKGLDIKGKEIEFVEYIVEENGEKKMYKTKLRGQDGKPSYLVQRLAEIEEGQEIRLEMKKKGIKNYISVDAIHSGDDVEVQEDDEESEPDSRDLEDTMAM